MIAPLAGPLRGSLEEYRPTEVFDVFVKKSLPPAGGEGQGKGRVEGKLGRTAIALRILRLKFL